MSLIERLSWSFLQDHSDYPYGIAEKFVYALQSIIMTTSIAVHELKNDSQGVYSVPGLYRILPL